ncbi:MAG: hypothetical protein ACJAVK_002246 [Akkermansiaceae bacterium]|jgi:hypothetical protein
MKALLVLLLISVCPVFGKTWIDLLAKADFHEDHPGKKIAKIEPALVWSLVTSSFANSAYDSVAEISQIEDPAQKGSTLRKLRQHWLKLRATREDFLLAQKGETRFAIEIAKDFNGSLKLSSLNLDPKPMAWKDDFPHQVTTRELLEFPLDPDASREKLIASLERQFLLIRNTKPWETNAELKKPPLAKDLAFYRKHPNGPYELYTAGVEPFEFIKMVDRRLEINLLHKSRGRGSWQKLITTQSPVPRTLPNFSQQRNKRSS